MMKKAKTGKGFVRIQDTPKIERYNLQTNGYNFDLVFRNSNFYFWAYDGVSPNLGSNRDIIAHDFADSPEVETYLEGPNFGSPESQAMEKNTAYTASNRLSILKKVNRDSQ